jgi:hypothetical protein
MKILSSAAKAFVFTLRTIMQGTTHGLVDIVAETYSLQMKSAIGSLVTAKSVAGFGSPIQRRMHRLFKNWRFFCARNSWKQNIHCSALPKRFLACRVGSLVLAGPVDRSSNPLDAPFLFGSGKGQQSFSTEQCHE